MKITAKNKSNMIITEFNTNETKDIAIQLAIDYLTRFHFYHFKIYIDNKLHSKYGCLI